ncbi:hypothetical protein MUO32_10700 [Shinella sp. CPCC 101442]|uniref:hypothetical protein n=1 Tax=Shinella sp. CPCC 101442 TaxID=2932265 RepID=UPI002152BC4F|nr:hypothetical protein [Shinella sp. CPCC 101442]MCR6499503.1 hypothetical protein [Shinella sp. CPCC 101442]
MPVDIVHCRKRFTSSPAFCGLFADNAWGLKQKVIFRQARSGFSRSISSISDRGLLSEMENLLPVFSIWTIRAFARNACAG